VIYYLNGYVRIVAADDGEALRKFEDAGLGPDAEVADGVMVAFEGDWDEIVDEPACTCPPDLVARGGFSGGCPVHA
jgi:hypothetical protein